MMRVNVLHSIPQKKQKRRAGGDVYTLLRHFIEVIDVKCISSTTENTVVYLHAESRLYRLQGCVLMDLCNMSILSVLRLDFCYGWSRL